MESRSTVIKSNYKDYVSRRNRSLLHQEQVARKERSEYQKQQEKFRQIQQKVEHRQNVISRQDPHGGALLKKTMHRVKAYEARFEKDFQNMTEIPEVEDAIFVKFGEEANIPAGKVVLDYHCPELWIQNELLEGRCLSRNINLFIRGAEHICIIGKNGCGKTTLLRKIAEELLSRTDIKVSYMPQNYEELLDMTKTPVEYLAETGNKDEPTRNFSPLSNPVIRQMLTEFKGAIISVSHDRKYIEEVADKVYELTETGLEIKKE